MLTCKQGNWIRTSILSSCDYKPEVWGSGIFSFWHIICKLEVYIRRKKKCGPCRKLQKVNGSRRKEFQWTKSHWLVKPWSWRKNEEIWKIKGGEDIFQTSYWLRSTQQMLPFPQVNVHEYVPRSKYALLHDASTKNHDSFILPPLRSSKHFFIWFLVMTNCNT